MITQEQWYGGSQSVSGNATLSLNGPRFHRATGGSPIITLPALTNHKLDAQDYGLRYIIAHNGLGTMTVRDAGLSTLTTASANRLVYVYLYDSGGTPTWVAHKRVDGTARAAVSTARGTIVEADAPPTYDPDALFCFLGNDCEYANAEPLDGQDGRELAIVPMFLNPCVLAQNQSREAIRGADVIMPSACVVRFADGCFAEDPLHPLAGGLSDEFYAALYNGGNPHRLVHDIDEKLTGSTSRNPYHLRISTVGAWTYNAVSCVKHVWQKLITYEVGLNTYTLTLRFQAEHTVSDEPGLTGYTTDVPGDQGGKHNATAGAWGTLFWLGIFTDELSNGFADGGTHTPAGASAPIAFSMHDPFVWGQAPGVSEGIDDKFCHPQLAAIAMLPTTAHDPCRFLWIPPVERETVPGSTLPGYNLEWAYRRPNCMPWITDPDRDLDNLCTGCGNDAIFANTLFSNDNLSNPLAAITTGGALPESRPTERLLWENGLGVGRTYLIPGTPSWDEEIGELSPSTASCGSISLCIDWNGSWSEYAFETCDGHPAEMFNDVGGTHYCFKNQQTGSEVQCCIAIESARADWEKVCVRFWVDMGGKAPPPAEVCLVTAEGCYERGHYTTQVEMPVYDYFYATSANPLTSRKIEWRSYDVIPSSTLWHYTYDQADVADVTQLVGTWTLGTTITVTPTGSETLTAMLAYDPPRDIGDDGPWRDAICSVQFRAATSVTHGIGFRMYDDAGNDAFGYGGFIEPTGVGTGNAKIAVYDNGVETVLASQAIVLDDDVVDVVFTVHGHHIVFEWEVAGQDPASLEVNHCEYTEVGTATLFTKTTAAEAEFADWAIIDRSYKFGYHYGTLEDDAVRIWGDEELLNGYGECAGTNDYCCGECCEPECCNCRSWYDQLYEENTSIWTGPGDMLDDPPTNPTTCGGGHFGEDCFTMWCMGNIEPCGQCPRPFRCINFCIPSRCFDETRHYAADDEPLMCKGLTQWCEAPEVCA